MVTWRVHGQLKNALDQSVPLLVPEDHVGLIEITFNETYIMKKPDRSKLRRMEVSNETDCRLFRHSSTGLGGKKPTLRIKHLFTDSVTMLLNYHKAYKCYKSKLN